MKENYVIRRICRCIGILPILLVYLNGHGNGLSVADAKEDIKTTVQNIYAEDERLEPVAHETYEYDQNPVGNYMHDSYTWVAKSYSEEEMAEFSHAYFDERNRLRYVLGYSSGILGDSSSYCEENIYEWDDEEHTCRYIYYKSNSMPYDSGYYVAYRYMFEVSNYKFDSDGRLLTQLSYRRNVGSDRYGYSDELFFDRGYQADYDGERLVEELQYIDFWGSNEVGAWEHRIYQYDEHGDCILKVVTTEDEIILYYYEYDEKAGKVDEYTYQVKEDWELACDDGSIVYFRPQWQSPAVKKVSADGTVEKELFYGKAIDMGQQHYLMPQDVEDTLDDHIYVVKPGDCLWNIAYKNYGHGSYYELLHRVNRSVIGWDENLILPGMRLYIPEAGNAQDTKIRSY